MPTAAAMPLSTRPPRGLRPHLGPLVVAWVFSLLGGYLDAYSYLAHDHVFAAAQTGNVVLMAAGVSAGDWMAAARHLPPILAFALGVAAHELLDVKYRYRTYHATLLCQGLQLALLCGLALFITALPKGWVVPILAFVAAVQFTSFNTVGPWSFATIFTTGNLKDLSVAAVQWATGQARERSRNRALALGSIILAFAAGALLGSVVTRWNAGAALLPAVGMVAAGLLLTLRLRAASRGRPSPAPRAPR